jgi:raffinose/stachyose/melibiose transport system substrate-binding protein
MKKMTALLLVLLMVAGLVLGCQSNTPAPTQTPAATSASAPAATEAKGPEPVTLRIYAQYADEDTKVPYDYAVAELAKAYPHVTLELDVQAQDDGAKLQTYAATGNLPDIFQVGAAQIETFKESGNIMILDDFAISTGFLDLAHPNASSIIYNADGHIYAFPYAGNELVMWYYNKAIFDQFNVKVPETMEELKTAIATFQANNIIPMSIFAKEKWITTALYDSILTRYLPEGITALDLGMASATDEPFRQAANTLKELVDLGMFPQGATNLNYDQAAALFYEGKAAMFINGQWEIEGSTGKLGDAADWMWYPAAAGFESNSRAFSGGGAAGGYAVSPHSKHKELAAEVAAFISQKYCEAKYMFRSNPILSLDVTGLVTPEKPMPSMMQKLSDEMGAITSTTKFAWGLTQPEFKVAIEDQTQFLLTQVIP